MRILTVVNALGVVCVAALCVFQWRSNLALNLEINRLEKIRLEQEARLAEQERNIRGLESDLAQFKEQFSRSQMELSQTRQDLRSVAEEKGQLTFERDQLKSSITNWTEAVQLRDARLREANVEISKLAEEANAAVAKFNQLATNYNAVVRELNATRK